MVKVLKDIITDHELCSDSYTIEKKYEDTALFVKSNYIEVTDDCGIANNDEDGGEADGPQRVLNIQHHFNLVDTAYKKAEYMTWVKAYMKRLLEKVTEKNPTRVPIFKTQAQTFVKFVIDNIANCSFYINNDNNEEGMVVPALWTNAETGDEGPTFLYFADGLREEKY